LKNEGTRRASMAGLLIGSVYFGHANK